MVAVTVAITESPYSSQSHPSRSTVTGSAFKITANPFGNRLGKRQGVRPRPPSPSSRRGGSCRAARAVPWSLRRRLPRQGGCALDVRVRRLGPNSFGEQLTPGAVEDCYPGLLVDQPLAATLPAPGSLVVVGPSALLDSQVRQPDGRAVYDLLTGHPDRSPRDLVFLADLA